MLNAKIELDKGANFVHHDMFHRSIVADTILTSALGGHF